MKIFRKEHFGGVLYDTDTLRFGLVRKIPEGITIDRIIKTEEAKRKDILSAPVRVYYELLTKCNLTCKPCFASSSLKGEYGKPTEDIKLVLDELSKAGVIDVRFTGGEPTLRNDLWSILKHAKEHQFSVSVNTNGVYEDPATVARNFADLDLEQVTISIDGVRENHDFMRGKGNFEKAIESMKLMKNAGVKLRINTVLTKINYQDIPSIVDLAALYALEVNFFYMRPIGRAIEQKSLSLDFDELYESSKTALTLRDKYPHLSIMHFEQSFTERSIDDFCSDLQQGYPYGNTTLNLDWKGNVWPHGYSTYQDDRFKVGNIYETPLREIWEGSDKLEKMRKWFRSLMERCNDCSVYKVKCAGYNFEMELAKSAGAIENNPFCISQAPIPDIKL